MLYDLVWRGNIREQRGNDDATSRGRECVGDRRGSRVRREENGKERWNRS